MRIIAYYTKDTPYEEEALVWKYTYERYPHKVYEVENQGSWELNCGLKSKIIKQALLEWEEPILYTDIDSRLMRDLEPIPEPHLPGFCIWEQPWEPHSLELLSGTIYFPYNKEALDLVDDWINLQQQNKTVWDQRVLQHIVFSDKYKYFEFPLEWICMDRNLELPNPIIFHTQASRRNKSKVKL